MNFKALGKKATKFQGFETFKRPPNIDFVNMISDEVTALCPVTGQPDWYKVKILYKPTAKCIESKTLKLYLQSFRNSGLFCEAFADRIAEEIDACIEPEFVSVEIEQKPRGGVAIHATAVRENR